MDEKRALGDLAYFGGKPLFPEPVYIGAPNTGNRQRFFAYANQALDDRWLTNNGRLVKQLEEKLADLLQVNHCVLVNNGTIGLMIALRALEVSGEVIVPSFTFVATVHALEWMGLTPVFCDVDPQTHNLDPQAVNRLITKRTKAILGVHLWGQPCAVVELASIAQQHDIKLLFDAAHAFAGKADGVSFANFGDAEVFSFHATKFFNTFEGGAITTNDPQLAERMRLLRNFGFAGVDNVISGGINAKLNEISAAMGLTLLEELPELLASLRRNYKRYEEFFAEIPGIRQIIYPDIQANNCQYIVVEVNESEVKRDLLHDILQKENIIVRRYFYPGCHRMEPYRSQNQAAAWHLPVTESLVQRVLCFPNNAWMPDSQLTSILELLQFVFSNRQEINSLNQQNQSG